MIIPHRNAKFELSKAEGLFPRSVIIGPGFCIKNDSFIHVKQSMNLNFEVDNNYDGPLKGVALPIGPDYKYIIALRYFYKLTIPEQKANYVIIKDHDYYWQNKDNYIYLGSAEFGVSGSPGSDYYYITNLHEEDTITLNDTSTRFIKREYYKFTPMSIDGGNLGTLT